MKKYIILFLIFFSLYILYFNSYEEKIIVPEKSLRIRIIPNSNSAEDQIEKTLIKEKIMNVMSDLLKSAKDEQAAKKIIINNLDYIENEVKTVIKNNNYELKFGYNFFEEKTYKGVTYNSGYYESLIIELGKKKGNNWWCVLYPPICLIDEEDMEYKSLVKELINKYF